MSKVQNIDQVMDAHSSFLCSIVYESMLTTPVFLDKIAHLLSLCLEFAKRFSDKKTPSNTKFATSSVKKIVDFDEEFSTNLVQFLREVGNSVQLPHQSSKVVNIIHRYEKPPMRGRKFTHIFNL